MGDGARVARQSKQEEDDAGDEKPKDGAVADEDPKAMRDCRDQAATAMSD